MKKMLFFINFLFIAALLHSQPIKIMLVTGGHSYDTIQFFQMFDAFENVEYEHFLQPKANRSITEGITKDFDVLVFYDMWKTISESEKEVYVKLTKQGKPFLFLHHTLAAYQNWPEFEDLLGGKYVEKGAGVPADQQSTYQHDVWVDVEVAGSHPVVQGINDFRLFDEVYGNFRVSEKVIPLLKTNHPNSTKIIGWENVYNSSKIIYLQPGHDFHSFESENFRKLVLQSINYLAKRK